MSKTLLVLLHGYGSNPSVMAAVGEQLSSVLPGLTVLTPPGEAQVGGSHRWFPIQTGSEAEIERGVRTAAPGLHHYLDEQKQRFGLEDHQLVLGGFSQGAILALHVGLRRILSLGGILAYSGFLSARNKLHEISSRPPVLLVHGQKDPIVPVSAHHLTRQALESAGVPVTAYVSEQAGHTVDRQGIKLAMDCLQKVKLGLRA